MSGENEQVRPHVILICINLHCMKFNGKINTVFTGNDYNNIGFWLTKPTTKHMDNISFYTVIMHEIQLFNNCIWVINRFFQ